MLSAIILFGESVDTSGLGWESRSTAEKKQKNNTHTEVTSEDLSHWSDQLWALTLRSLSMSELDRPPGFHVEAQRSDPHVSHCCRLR